MVGRAEHLVLRPRLDHFALLHHHHVVRDRAHRREVVGDEHVGEVELVLKPAQEPEDPLRDELVEGARHLVADDERGLRGEGAGDSHPLLLPARELRRHAMVELRRLELDLVEELVHPLLEVDAAPPAVEGHRPPDDLADPLLRIERGVGHLVDHLRLAELVLGPAPEARRQRLPVVADLPRGRGQEAGDAARRGRLAGARLADHRDGAAAVDVEGDVVQHLDRAIGRAHPAHRDDRGLPRSGRRLLFAAEASHRPQRLGVVLLRRREHGARVRLLDLVTPEQHLDPVGHLRDHREVVGDVERRGVELVDDVADGREHLDLRRDVERGGRLVEDDEVRPAAHRHRGHRPLELSPRDLVRIPETDLLGVGEPEAPVELHRVLLALAPGPDLVLDRRGGVLVDELVGGVERGGRGLRHVGDARTAQHPQILLRRGGELDAVELDGAIRDPAPVAGEAHGGEPDRGLAGPRLPDETHHLAAVQVEVDAMHDLEPLLVGPPLDAKAPDLEQKTPFLFLVHGVTP